ncbi:C4-dicarboxylate transporter DcuC [uncultured Photobacterium sp.]|uniref:C4-dicarboxylate transporter DcuC n=1 Tax=uncultured Photobacterium sp. TaxID=173973 RepID=UPI002601974A|nr:C4-dicarboxylate transporter DcuC [uncultured Photobacterium sp.]
MVFLSIAVIFLAIYLLIKQFETRMVLIGTGTLLCLLANDPMSGFTAFSKYMVSANLIMAICSSMGFAMVMKHTTCDIHLVRVLSKPLSKLGFFLIPATVIVTYTINIAIPSAAGCAAAVGATLIPLLLSSRIHPAIAGAAVLCGTIGSLLSPGLSHNPFVAEMSDLSVVELITRHSPYSITVGFIAAISLAVVAFVRKEFNLTSSTVSQEQTVLEKANLLYAFAPFIPLILLVIANAELISNFDINVPTAMIIGAIYAMVVTRGNPGEATKSFFNGMGSAYGNILGIIIAAAVFSQGLKSSGLVSLFIDFLVHSPEFARWGGTLGPFLMGIMTGSGDAAAYAFNSTVTSQAAVLGYQIPDLGMGVAISGALGRTMSPLAGSVIVCAGLAGVTPLDLVKRTALGMVTSVFFIALFML